jgi:hypothetical protein
VIGHDEATGKVYALGVTSADTPIYMEVISSQSVRVISEADWDAVKPGCSLPIVIPLYPVHGDPFYQLSGTSKTVGAITYVGKKFLRSNCVNILLYRLYWYKFFVCLHGDKIYNSFVCGNTKI